MSLGCTIFGFHLDTGIYLRLVWSHHERSFSHGPVHQWLNRSYGAIGPPNEQRGCQPNRRRTSCDHFLPIAFGQWYAAIACPQQRFCVRPTCVWISTRDPFAEKFTVIDSVPNTTESTTPKCVDWGSRDLSPSSLMRIINRWRNGRRYANGVNIGLELLSSSVLYSFYYFMLAQFCFQSIALN